MAGKSQPHEFGEDKEREVLSYLKALGWLVMPAMNFANEGAPMLQADRARDSLIMPDSFGMKSGQTAWFEVKWKKASIVRRTHKRNYTGIDRNNYDHYRRVQVVSTMPVVVVFLHETEDEVRCGTLDTLDLAQAPHCTQEQYRDSKGGMHNWWYDAIPLWMSYAELKRFVAEHRDRGKRAWPPALLPIADRLKPIEPEKQTIMFGAAWGAR